VGSRVAPGSTNGTRIPISLIYAQFRRIKSKNDRLNPPLASGKHMRIVQVLAFGVFATLLVAGGAWALAWWGTPRPPDPIEAGLEAKPELKSPGALETAPERRSTGEIQAAPRPSRSAQPST
jgi:hypothetical protein